MSLTMTSRNPQSAEYKYGNSKNLSLTQISVKVFQMNGVDIKNQKNKLEKNNRKNYIGVVGKWKHVDYIEYVDEEVFRIQIVDCYADGAWNYRAVHVDMKN